MDPNTHTSISCVHIHIQTYIYTYKHTFTARCSGLILSFKLTTVDKTSFLPSFLERTYKYHTYIHTYKHAHTRTSTPSQPAAAA